MKFYPKNGLILVAVLFLLTWGSFSFLTINTPVENESVAEGIFGSFLITCGLAVLPFISMFKMKIEIIDSSNFTLYRFFSNNTYSVSDITKVLICERYGAGYTIYVLTHDNKSFMVSSTFWSHLIFETIREYFTKMAPMKVDNRLE